jgi:putative PIN family toxin of toxin-antitoxin system
MKVERAVVIDTNVLISAALIKASMPAMLLGRLPVSHRIVFSPATFAELETRLWRPKFDPYLSMEQRALLLHDLGAVADWVEHTDTTRFSRDADDDKFVHAALAAQAAWLISGDRDLLDLREVQGVAMLTAAEAWSRIA